MSTIDIRNLSFGYDVQRVLLFDSVSVSIQSNWKLGLVGRNGRGKTTLLELLMRKHEHTGSIGHSLKMHYFPQKISDENLLTKEVLEKVGGFEQWKIERELRLMGLSENILWRPFKRLSGGEQTKVRLALLFLEKDGFALIDEPTNHLDKKGRKQVADYLKKKKQGFILVSHDRTFVDEVIDHVLSIEKNQLIVYTGNFQTYEDQKERRDHYELEENKKIKREVNRLKQTAAEKKVWSNSREKDKYKSHKGYIDSDDRRIQRGSVGADAARTMKRSKAIVRRMEAQVIEKSKLLKNIEISDRLAMNSCQTHHERILRVEKVQLRYLEPLFAPISFELLKGERIAIEGENGSGKSSLLRALMGEFDGTQYGEIQKPLGIRMSTVRQNYEDNCGSLKEFAKRYRLVYEEFLSHLTKLGIERTVFDTPIEKMSLGQRKRVELAKSLSTPAELFLWDEPFNYLDVFNQKQIEELLVEMKPTLIFVEHDQRLIEQLATKKIVLSNDKEEPSK